MLGIKNPKKMKVFKFGGASVKDASGVKNLVRVLNSVGYKDTLVVVSAMGKTTNALEKVIEAYFEKSQRYVTGNVFVELSPYNFRLNGIKSDHDLMNHNLGVYGEENTNWSSDDIKGFIKISSNSSKIFKQINK